MAIKIPKAAEIIVAIRIAHLFFEMTLNILPISMVISESVFSCIWFVSNGLREYFMVVLRH